MPEQKRKGKKWAVVAVVLAILAVAGFGMYQWHETPGFCAAFCHNMDEYLETYSEEQNTSGVDKYGNEVTNTNAMMATLHRETKATAMPEIRCMACHQPAVAEQIAEGTAMVTGNYYDPLNERVGEHLTEWSGRDETQFCVNESCHVYLRGADGLLDKAKLEKSTEPKAANTGFNPHDTHHAGIDMSCTSCHKGHRASVMMCTSCHEHEDVALPEGWITAEESNKLMNEQFPGYYDETYKSLPRAA